MLNFFSKIGVALIFASCRNTKGNMIVNDIFNLDHALINRLLNVTPK
jgi:hypothetical protein